MLGNLVGVPNACFADFEEVTAGAKGGEALGNEVAGEGIEDNINTCSVGESFNLGGKVEGAGVHDVTDAEGFQQLPFGGRCGGEDFGSDVLGNLNGGLPDASGGSVNQNAIAGFNLADDVQRIVGGEKGSRNGGGGFNVEMIRNWDHQVGIDGDIVAKAGRGDRHHGLADVQVLHVLPYGDDVSCTFEAECSGVTRIETKGVEQVAEVESGGANVDFDVMGAGGTTRNRVPGEGIEAAALGNLELQGLRGGGRRGWLGCDLSMDEPRSIAVAVAKGDVKFAIGDVEFVEKGLGDIVCRLGI